MPTIDTHYEPRLYLCSKCESVLGVVLRGASDRVRRLYVLEAQVRDATYLPSDLRNMAIYVVRGMDSGEVACNRCGSARLWRASTEAMRDLLRKVGGEEMVMEFNGLEGES